MKKDEALKSIQGMWEKFSKLTGFPPPPTSKDPPFTKSHSKFSCYKAQTNVMDDKGFIHPAKSSKNLTFKTKNTPNINTDNKFETLSNMSDDCADMEMSQKEFLLNPSRSPFL